MKAKHSKFRNTGMLFEFLTRQITTETLKGEQTPSVRILKKHFSKKSEMLKEYQIYNALSTKKYSDSTKATALIESCLNAHKSLNKSQLRREKFNLVKDLKEQYGESVFKLRIGNYKLLASIYHILEDHTDPITVTNNKITIVEHIVIEKSEKAPNTLESFDTLDKGTKKLVYKLMMEKFNEKYSVLGDNQKALLKEYIYTGNDYIRLKTYVNKEIMDIKSQLSEITTRVTCDSTRIKIREVSKLIKPLCDKVSINEDNIINLLNYYGLLNELNTLHPE